MHYFAFVNFLSYKIYSLLCFLPLIFTLEFPISFHFFVELIKILRYLLRIINFAEICRPQTDTVFAILFIGLKKLLFLEKKIDAFWSFLEFLIGDISQVLRFIISAKESLRGSKKVKVVIFELRSWECVIILSKYI